MDKGKETCLNRIIGRCRDCREDYSDNHPNNLDCLRYQGVKMHVFNVQENYKKYAGRNVK